MADASARLHPFLKWPGGKEGELDVILRNIPGKVDRYFEPFVGGGAVLLALGNPSSFINDKSEDLMTLYRLVAMSPDSLGKALREAYGVFRSFDGVVDDEYPMLEAMHRDAYQGRDVKKSVASLVDGYLDDGSHGVPRYLLAEGKLRTELIRCLDAKIRRMCKLEKSQGDLCEQDRRDNYECGLKGGMYMALRRVYNAGVGGNVDDVTYAAAFYFVREYCYSSMFRYNKSGEFNVPYGGISYNRKDFDAKIDYLTSPRLTGFLAGVTMGDKDFADFLDEHVPQKGDFVFVDPPYDSEFSTYDQNSFGRDDQKRLADWLAGTEANVMVVIKRTDFIHDLYESRGFHIASFDKKYQVSFKARNDRDVTHLLITNYGLGDDDGDEG